MTYDSNKQNAMVVISGNCRTFIDCIDSCYTNVITKLFSQDNYNIFLYLYLKIKDPGPKGQTGWDFIYTDVDYSILVNKINEMIDKYKHINVEYKILENNEISDNDLYAEIKDRSKYQNRSATDKYWGIDSILLRSLHCYYNYELCGKYILNKENELKINFNYIIWIRPDLYFIEPAVSVERYNNNVVTCGQLFPNCYNTDHMALIPRKYFTNFFFDRIEVFRNNTEKIFVAPEELFWSTIKYEEQYIGKYYIKRQGNSLTS